MLLQNNNNSIQLESFSWKIGIQEYLVDQWDLTGNMAIKTKIQIQFTQNRQIIYLKDGSILRIDPTYDTMKTPEIFNNMEQIDYLYWQSENGLKNKKHGRWIAYWNGEQMMKVGGYYKDGQQQGLWRELSKNYQNKAQVYEIGEYQSGQRRGKWNYMYQNKVINGGMYNNRGQKIGKWIELFEAFSSNSQVIYCGEYTGNGNKIGRWDIFYKWCDIFGNSDEDYKQIGGGVYEEKCGVSIKIGKWIELSEGFYNSSQVTYNGEYNYNGQKKGRWNIMNCFRGENLYKLIGGGQYDESEGDSKKIGTWVELSDRFNDWSQITYRGAYDKNGVKFGRWDIMHTKNYGNYQTQQIGGGQYDVKEGNSYKSGKWIELSEDYRGLSQIICVGDYNNNGYKIGRWYTNYKVDQEFQNIGGGFYAEQDLGLRKIGDWIEIWENFGWMKEIIYVGEYNIQGEKRGRWDTFWCELGKNKLIGGGYYNESEEGSRKIGRWTEVKAGFLRENQIIYTGEYSKDGQKKGRWNILLRKDGDKDDAQIGGGSYNDEQDMGTRKIGDWIELVDESRWKGQIIYHGQYNEVGIKVGTWVKMDLDKNKKLDEIKYKN